MNIKITKYLPFFLLLLICCFAFFIRTYFSYGAIFSDGIVKYIDDGVYHMRFLENLLLGGHFPRFIYFDAFTNFPHGSSTVPPMYDLILGVFIWIISFGKPTTEIINKIAPFYPVFLGSLVPVAVYFLAKAVWNNEKVSLVASLITATTPAILLKSILASNDHHVAEVLFSSTAMVFLFYALKSKKRWFFIILCGISLGIYCATWAGSVLFLFIIFSFLVVYYLIEFICRRPANWILISGVLIFLISFLAIAPLLGYSDLGHSIYNVYHLIAYGGGFLGFLALYIFSLIFEKKSIKKRWLIIPALAGTCVLALLALKIISPYLFAKFLMLANGFNTNGALSAASKGFVSEMNPLGYQGAINAFYSLFFLFVIGFFMLVYDFLKNKKPEHLLLIIWSAITFIITGVIPYFGQLRFNIYFSINIALLAGLVIVKGFEIGWRGLGIGSRLEKDSPFRLYLITGSIAILVGVLFFIIYPFPFNAAQLQPQSLPSLVSSSISAAKNPLIFDQDWYKTLKWLKEETPDPGVNYYELYDRNEYKYPEQAYGILARWDKGHVIEYYSHRLPVANNFQQGIGYINDDGQVEAGEGTFFLETNEAKAYSYLDELKAKYVVVDPLLSSPNTSFRSYVKWINGKMDDYTSDKISSTLPTKFDLAISSRLFFEDGNSISMGEKGSNFYAPPLSRLRLVYESDTDVPINSYLGQNTSKEVKVFEYVAGAKIKGWAASKTEINISSEITTNQGRKFTYEQKITAKDNTFEFTVPYANDYTIKIGSYNKKIRVLEDDVLQGKTIKVNF